MQVSLQGRICSSLKNQLTSWSSDSRSKRTINLRGLNLSRQGQLVNALLAPQASSIVSLDISHSRVDKNVLSAFVGILTHLKEFSASNCLLKDAHLENVCLPQLLEVINLSRNNLTKFPGALKELVHLRTINLGGNEVSSIDVAVLRLPSLHSLNLINNGITSPQRHICQQGVAAMRAYFNVSPLNLPCSEEQVHTCKPPLAAQLTESGYSSATSCSSLPTENVPNFSQFPTELWLDPEFCPFGYWSGFNSQCCRVFLPKDVSCNISVKVIQDHSLHPPLKSNGFLITPVVCVEPHGCTFPDKSPAMIALPHCTSANSRLQVFPLCSSTSLTEPVSWQELDCSLCEVLPDCLVLTVHHFSLFAAIAIHSYPSVSVHVSPSCGGVVTMAELPGLELRFPANCINRPLVFKTTLLYSDPEYHKTDIDTPALASACIAVEPHATELLVPVEALLPVPDATNILRAFPGSQLQLFHATGPHLSKDELSWQPMENTRVCLEEDVARFSVTHFSYFKLLWSIPSLTLQRMRLGASYMYQSIRSVRISVRCQVFMSPPILRDLSFGMLVAFFKFGNPLRSPSNYRWLLADTGDKRIFVRTGNVSLELGGCFTPLSIVNREELSRKMNVTFTGEDFCLRAEFALKLEKTQLPLADYQLLGKLVLTQFDGTRFLELNLIKPVDNEFNPTASSTSECVIASSRHSAPVTPPFTPLREKPLTLRSPPLGKGKRRSHSNSAPSLAKRSLVIKQGEINSDQELLLVAHDIASCWDDVGTRLGLDYNQLQSLATTHAAKSSHMLAYHMLQCWRRQECDQATYSCLCEALEEAGMSSYARLHCYLNQDSFQS